jgi:hypothetical protein
VTLFFFFFAEAGKILFVENLVGEKEKRKIAYWGMQGDPETSDPFSDTFLKSLLTSERTPDSILVGRKNGIFQRKMEACGPLALTSCSPLPIDTQK